MGKPAPTNTYKYIHYLLQNEAIKIINIFFYASTDSYTGIIFVNRDKEHRPTYV
jgi:hypothetical protein